MEGTDESQESKVVVGRLNEDEWAGCDKQVIAEEEHADDLDLASAPVLSSGSIFFPGSHALYTISSFAKILRLRRKHVDARR